MSRAPPVEIDFFAMEKARSVYTMDKNAAANRGTDFSAFSRINPLLLRRAFSPANAVDRPISIPAIHRASFLPPPSVPVLDRSPRSASEAEMNTDSVSAPLTIFYNGTVTVFDLSHDKADAVMKLAEESTVNRGSSGQELLATLSKGMLPLARKKSLQRFLEKRKERIMTTGPYKRDHAACAVSATT